MASWLSKLAPPHVSYRAGMSCSVRPQVARYSVRKARSADSNGGFAALPALLRAGDGWVS